MFFYTSIFGLVLIFKIEITSQFEIESNVNNNSNFLSTGLTYPLILNHIFITEKNRIYFICLSISFFFFLLHLVFYARETSTQYGLIILEPTYSRNMFSK